MLVSARRWFLTVSTSALLTQWQNWIYESRSSRDLRLDLLRGFCLFAMLVDHIAGPSALYHLTGGNGFFVSAAEGFVFISGLLLGITSRKTIERSGFGAVVRKSLRRSGMLYLLMVALTLAFNIGGLLLGLPWLPAHTPADLMAFTWSVVGLRQSYWLTDILTLYTLLIVASPLALWLMQRNRTRWLLAGSWVAWLLYQLAPDLLGPLLPATQSFNPVAWQIFFMHALVVGYHRERLGQFWTPGRRRALVLVSGALVAMLLGLFHGEGTLSRVFGSGFDPWLQAITDKGGVAIGRLVAAAAVFPFAYLVVTYLWVPLQRCVGWLLVPIGQRSLTGYALHLPLVLLALRLEPALASHLQLTEPARNAAVQVSAVLVVWLLVQWRAILALRSSGALRWIQGRTFVELPDARARRTLMMSRYCK